MYSIADILAEIVQLNMEIFFFHLAAQHQTFTIYVWLWCAEDSIIFMKRCNLVCNGGLVLSRVNLLYVVGVNSYELKDLSYFYNLMPKQFVLFPRKRW